jgi:hypothetical protein
MRKGLCERALRRKQSVKDNDMSLNDQIFALVRAEGPASCLRFLDEHGPGRNSEERRVIAHWRAAFLANEGQNDTALRVLGAAASDFTCRSSFALQKARILRGMGRVPEAIATLRAAPIAQEISTFPALALEAAYFCCYLMLKQGEAPPRDLLDLIPDDFETVVDDRFIAKNNLVSGKL